MDSSLPSLRLDESHSLYLLGQHSSSPLLKRYRPLIEGCAKLGEFLSFEMTPEWLSCYERDAQHVHAKLPLLVFRPHTIASIAPFLRACHQMDVSVTARCGGTGLAGCCVPSREGVILLTGHLRQMRAYDPEKGTIYLEPGVTARQLNRYVEADGWFFPLAMATEGVAGIAGCLSCQARGYHQQQQAIFDAIESVTLVDGQGQVIVTPSAWACGAEGLWGILIEMKVQLKRRPPQSQDFIYQGSWQDVLAQLSLLRSLRALHFVTWSKDKFYLGVAGESWRLIPSIEVLTRHLPGIQSLAIPLKPYEHSFLPSRKSFIVLSTVFHSLQLPEACQRSLAQAKELQLECFQQADVLAGSLHLTLQSADSFYHFSQKVEQFLVLWVDFVDRQRGVIASCHGVGMQMRPYMTPFWTEETQHLWQKLQAAFDPKGLFSKERFFPSFEKSLQKMRQV
jgi:FAD/FMN-containing dehydrogenase